MKISIIILNYNRKDLLPRAIRSAQNQIMLGFTTEIYILDDASTDGSRELLNSGVYRVRCDFNEFNLGVGASSRLAVERIDSDFFIRLDSDDFLSPIATLTLFSALENSPEYSYAYADHFRIDDQEKRKDKVTLSSFDELVKHGAGVLFRTQSVLEAGSYSDQLRHGEDADLLFRMKSMGLTGVHVPIPLYRYHIHGDNISLQPNQKIAQEQIRRMYPNVE
jgi:glycosyltransferase involved in cell wall biosynthesis